MIKLERDYVTAQLAAVNRMLDRMPSNDYLGRVGFEARRDDLTKQLEDLEFDETRAQIAVYFGGDPVVGSLGIEAEFGSQVVGSLQDLVSKVWGTLDGAPLQPMGPVKGKDASHLHITSVVHGSFGFILEELDESRPFFQTTLSKAADQVAAYIESFAGENDATFSEIIDALNPRVFQAIRQFFGYVHKGNATFRLVEGERDAQYDRNAVERAWNRAEASNVAEERLEVSGKLLGVIPMKRRFELQSDQTGLVIEGRVGEQFTSTYLERINNEQIAGKRWLAVIHKRTVTKIGRDPVDAYTLLQLHSLEDVKA